MQRIAGSHCSIGEAPSCIIAKHHNQSSHPPNIGLILVLLQARIQVLPPFKEERVAYKLEPRGKLECRVVEHGFQLVCCNVLGISHFVFIRYDVDIGLDE